MPTEGPNPLQTRHLRAGAGGQHGRETNLQAVGVLGGVDRGVGLVGLVPVAWGGAALLQDAPGKGPPARV